MKRLLICLDMATAGPRAAEVLHRFLLSRGWRVWHWLDPVWVVGGVPLDLAPSELWAELQSQPGLIRAEGMVCDLDPPDVVAYTLDERALDRLGHAWGPPTDSVARLPAGKVALGVGD